MTADLPQETVRVALHNDAPGWLGNVKGVTLELMPDGTVRWRGLERAGLTVTDEPGQRNADAIIGQAKR